VKYKIFGFLLATISASCIAGWQEGTVQQLLVHDSGASSGKFDLILENAVENEMSWCSSYQGWTGDLDNEGARAQYALLLAALMAGKKVMVYSDSTQNCPDGNRNRVRNVLVKSGG
jgi:hypothetical protein